MINLFNARKRSEEATNTGGNGLSGSISIQEKDSRTLGGAVAGAAGSYQSLRNDPSRKLLLNSSNSSLDIVQQRRFYLDDVLLNDSRASLPAIKINLEV